MKLHFSSLAFSFKSFAQLTNMSMFERKRKYLAHVSRTPMIVEVCVYFHSHFLHFGQLLFAVRCYICLLCFLLYISKNIFSVWSAMLIPMMWFVRFECCSPVWASKREIRTRREGTVWGLGLIFPLWVTANIAHPGNAVYAIFLMKRLNIHYKVWFYEARDKNNLIHLPSIYFDLRYTQFTGILAWINDYSGLVWAENSIYPFICIKIERRKIKIIRWCPW